MTPRAAFAFLALWGLIAGCASRKPEVAAHRDYVTDLDFTTPTRFEAESFRGRQPLREFGTNNVEGFSDNYIFGVYRNPMDLTGGHNFYVFPDGRFAVEEFCDICEPKIVASGRWKLEGDELAISDLVERKNISVTLGMKWIEEHFGPLDRLRLFVTGHDESIGDTILVSDETVRKAPYVEWKYIGRIKCYRDWPKEEEGLLGK
jgi:hypothetical protein